MGSGASVPEQVVESQERNKIFLDEGVGIEVSQLSRRWTSKMSILKKMDSRNFSELSPRQPTRIIHQIQEESSDEQISQSSYNSVSRKESLELKKHVINPTHYKKITTFQSVSDDSDIEERPIQERRQTKFKSSISDDSQDEKNEATLKIKEQMEMVLDEMSDRSSLDSGSDLLFTEQLDIDELMDEAGVQKQVMPLKFPLQRLYMRSRIMSDKMQLGQEKKVKFDAKQQLAYEEDFNFQDRKEGEEELKEFQPEDFLNQIGVAVVCKKGNKRDGPHMSDYLIYNDHYSKVIVLTNGHGEFGQYISNLTYRMVFHHLLHTPTFYTDPLACISQVLKRLQHKLKVYIDKKKIDDTYNTLLSGCVITLVVHRNQKVYLGHIGDNRVMIHKEFGNNNKQKKFLVELTPIHSPLDAIEKGRIFNNGGEVRKTASNDEYVYVRGRLYPQLHVTRSIGDVIAHVIGVNSVPYTQEYDVTNADMFLILTTGSSFLYLEQEDIMDHLTGFTLQTIRSACESLYKQAKSSWIINEGLFDDMTLIMLWLAPLQK